MLTKSFLITFLFLMDGISVASFRENLTGRSKKESFSKATGKLQSQTSEFLKVTLAIFSGRRDPQWVLYQNNQVYPDIRRRLDAARKNGLTYKRTDMPAILGYKGFLVNSELIVGPKTVELQKLLLQTMPENQKLDHIKGLLLKQIEKSPSVSPAVGRKKRVAPAYDPAPWNDPNGRLLTDNCYNYATNRPTGTIATPGDGSNHPMPVPFSDADVQKAAEFDGLVTLEDEFVANINGPFIIPPQFAATGHLVALVVSPPEFGLDFHWYRLDSDGGWSHKRGLTKVDRRDDLKNLIQDPRSAFPGNIPKYHFVCFMVTTANMQIA